MSEAGKSIHELNADLFEPEEDGRFADPREARKKAMDYLARREYGRQELIRKLVAAGFDPDAAVPAIDRLAVEGLQDDRRFVENFARSRVNQGKGPVRVQADLRQRGIDPGLIDEVLDALSADWRALAIEVRRKKFGSTLPRNFSDKAKQMRFLQYRGFSQAEIEIAIGDRGDDYD
ncbi:MAG: recombination regulator RecX [Gammaproteobacteria bacterium]|nr:recombination regulator RecX [Gammaproteobacteria bacterium]MDH4315692.1 recombination regulator RecX [Gammaproteobacteria bacterium]MDH5214123.1 recombination regulator RecX [Gammaproteobacteria bacterium]MDH5500025.1 recombination regulator RecX [Gammaproteobacteria bacterium]